MWKCVLLSVAYFNSAEELSYPNQSKKSAEMQQWLVVIDYSTPGKSASHFSKYYFKNSLVTAKKKSNLVDKTIEIQIIIVGNVILPFLRRNLSPL